MWSYDPCPAREQRRSSSADSAWCASQVSVNVSAIRQLHAGNRSPASATCRPASDVQSTVAAIYARCETRDAPPCDFENEGASAASLAAQAWGGGL